MADSTETLGHLNVIDPARQLLIKKQQTLTQEMVVLACNDKGLLASEVQNSINLLNEEFCRIGRRLSGVESEQTPVEA